MVSISTWMIHSEFASHLAKSPVKTNAAAAQRSRTSSNKSSSSSKSSSGSSRNSSATFLLEAANFGLYADPGWGSPGRMPELEAPPASWAGSTAQASQPQVGAKSLRMK